MINFITRDGIKLTKLNFHSVGKQIQQLLNDGEYRLILKPWRNKRTLPQNSLFHMWCHEISDYLLHWGWSFATPEWVKDAMKHTFLGYKEEERTDVVTGEKVIVKVLIKTSDLDTGAMHYFMSKVEEWAFYKGCLLTIPSNSEYMRIKEMQNE
ncbi:Uncharacterised protein [Plesiomonas shigelloides]|uniref:recombination protein NinB n=1 Tax=Plesiomonas shigelloides TaxID=703 RepID=UPI000E08BB3A|nr:Uncharacterised protein [Plesiomonas shigelloides]